jgi:hypothetical protein
MSNIYNLFKFLEKKKGTKTPFNAKLLYAPDELTDEELKIGGNLDLENINIETLPDNLKVGGYLDLENINIETLPDNLKVGGDLYLPNTKITSLPDNLKVGLSLYLKNTPIAKKYSEKEIRKMIEKKGGYVKRNIYV